MVNVSERLFRSWSGWRIRLRFAQPDTIIPWPREGFRLFWKWKSRRTQAGRKTMAPEIISLIRDMSRGAVHKPRARFLGLQREPPGRGPDRGRWTSCWGSARRACADPSLAIIPSGWNSESSGDLSQWQVIGTCTLEGGTNYFVSPNPSLGAQFYRVQVR